MSLRDELMSVISSVDCAVELEDGSPLISTSLLDSLTLFNLAMWIEEQTGAPIDLATIDLASDWDTIDSILRFIEARRAGAKASRGGG